MNRIKYWCIKNFPQKIIFFIYLTQVVTVNAQYDMLKFQHITVREGLSQNTVMCIQQDLYGFMWFGTFNGLNRYDGYNFKVYKKEAGNLKSLSSSRCLDMCLDFFWFHGESPIGHASASHSQSQETVGLTSQNQAE